MAPDPTKTAFIFVPGAFCPAKYYSSVLTLLHTLGYTALALDHPTMNLDAQPPSTGYDDAAQVRTTASTLLTSGKDVVLVGNSYGAWVCQEACKGLVRTDRSGPADSDSDADKGERRGELKHLVILAFLLATTGMTVKDLVGPHTTIPTDTSGIDIEGVVGPHVSVPIDTQDPNEAYINPVLEGVDAEYAAAMTGQMFCASLPEGERKRFGAMVGPISKKAFADPLTYEAWRYVPTTMVIGDRDLALRPEVQEENLERVGEGRVRKVVVEGGEHCLMLSRPDEVVRICLEVVG